MQLSERRQRYSAIENFRKRPLIVYATSTRPGIQAFMAGDAVREFVDQIDAIPADKKDIDILVHSTGGDPLAAWKLMSVLRERFEKVAVLVPYMAFSAATLFALGADEIAMHPHASLGPIDPQIRMPQADGTVRHFAYEDVGAFLRFIASEAKITEQAHLPGVVEKLFSVVDPVHVGAAKRASELSSDIGERLLLMHMTAAEDKVRVSPGTLLDHKGRNFRSPRSNAGVACGNIRITLFEVACYWIAGSETSSSALSLILLPKSLLFGTPKFPKFGRM